MSFCEGGGAFFIFSVVERLTGRGWAAAVYPAGGDPSTTAHPDGLHITGSIAGRARTRAVRTRLDAGHAAPVCTRYQTDRAGTIGQGAGRWTACALCPKLCRFGHSAAVQKYISFLNTFVARATENLFTVSQKCDIIMSQE